MGDSTPSPLPSGGAREVEPGFQNSTAEGTQSFSTEQGKHEISLRKLDEVALDNASRRKRENIGFYTILAVIIGGLVFSLVIGSLAKNDDTRNWAQGIFTLIVGSLLGALAGYFTGKKA